ncbi:B-box zinc finger protein 32-like isoform X3 [Salvia hispanica]|uniref:B-box zinc finger protein 32-like isoform X3 n=1 Tax=Salvia hispanica TaxID=49212 RepID=UPI002009B6AB|nr:B-box zinc finger protein 32-like isoform X3 [Salvia hispanica]
MRRCELCKAKARMYCASDRARLCWNCDAAVHSANFLVARHSRSLLCDVCQSPTPWTASGGKLAPTVAVCEQCAGQERCENGGGGESEAEEEQEAEEEENQVVPWSSTPPPPPESSSSGDESVDAEDVVVSRRSELRAISSKYPCSSALCGGGSGV